jgi:hypothetical protein
MARANAANGWMATLFGGGDEVAHDDCAHQIGGKSRSSRGRRVDDVADQLIILVSAARISGGGAG